ATNSAIREVEIDSLRTNPSHCIIGTLKLKASTSPNASGFNHCDFTALATKSASTLQHTRESVSWKAIIASGLAPRSLYACQRHGEGAQPGEDAIPNRRAKD